MASAHERVATFYGGWPQWNVFLHIFAWVAVIAAFVNLLCFILGTANPVMRSDDWYFFDVFVRKAIDGTLGVADFFVKRHGADHAQPLSKLVLWFEWRYLDLDVAFESIVGAVSALACGLILRGFIAASKHDDGRNAMRMLAWGVICALLFSLNSSGVWTWPLVALGYLTMVPALIFVWATWHALHSRRYGVLAVATIALAVVGDDNAIVVLAVVLAALLVVLLRDPALRHGVAWKTICIIAGCLILVRIGYAFAPVVLGIPTVPVMDRLSSLLTQAQHGDWWQWITLPLALSIAYKNPFGWVSDNAWTSIQLVMVSLLLIAHIAFWLRAFCDKHNLTTFAAVCLMLLSYAWLVGILVYRVSHFGSDYLHQARYVQLYTFNLIALLLMWAGPHSRAAQGYRFAMNVPAVGCVLLLAIQVPLALSAWRFRPYLLDYYRQMAMQIEMVASYPKHDVQCLPILPVCEWPKDKRAHDLLMLRSQRLNVFSPRVQGWHLYLPQTSGLPAKSVTAER